jgi:hypothetical protein
LEPLKRKLGDLGKEARIILKYILKIYGVRMQTGCGCDSSP